MNLLRDMIHKYPISAIRKIAITALVKVLNKPLQIANKAKRKLIKTGLVISLIGCITRKVYYFLMGQPYKGDIPHRVIEKACMLGIIVTNIGITIIAIQGYSAAAVWLLALNSLALILSFLNS